MLGNLDLFRQVVQTVCDTSPTGQVTQGNL